jgi:hypothetical protein
MRLLLVLIIAAAIGGYFTRPDANAHWATVAALIKEGKVDGGAISARKALFEEFYVATKYTFSVDGKEQAECWGAFTRFLCLKPGGTADVTAPTA